ncbi:MAG: Arm DNA-binding domain-containing protein [Pseudomonadales bacterium]|jgi:integrase
MGTKYTGVRAKSQTSIQIDFHYQGKRFRECIAKEPTATNLKKAANHRAAILDAIERGVFDYATTFPNSGKAASYSRSIGQISVDEFLTQWLIEKKPTLQAATIDGYRKIVHKQLIPNLGHHYLHELSVPHVRSWIATLECGNKRIRNILSPLRTALQQAVLDGLLEVNILKDWTYQKAESASLRAQRKAALDPFSLWEQKLILDSLSGEGKNLIQFAFWTGLRTSEMVALEWEDIDMSRGYITVNKGMTQAASVAEPPKTEAGDRLVKILPFAKDALLMQEKHSKSDGGIVFRNPRTLLPWTGDQAIRKSLWTPALVQSGVKYRRPYQTRHTYASMMISAGEKIGWISKQLGHANIGVTTSIYARWLDDADPNAGMKAHDIYSGKTQMIRNQKV